MRLTILLLGFSLSIFTTFTMAGSEHDHGHDHSHSHTAVNQKVASSNASEIVTALINRNKLDKSWGSISASSVEKITVQGNPEWKIIFVNEKISNPDKQKLYVFLTLGGDYIAANFSGK